MKLGTYTFEFEPDQFTDPKPDKFSSDVLTYSSGEFFSWGLSVIGKKILIEFETMTCDMYNRLKTLEQADAEVEWDPQITNKVFHGLVTNGPFVAGKTITGTGGGTATVSSVYAGEAYIVVTPLSGTLLVGDTITDNSSPAKTAIISSYENVGKFNVEIKSLDGAYVEVAGPNNVVYRKNVKIILFILGVV